jgi:hypothetical protein
LSGIRVAALAGLFLLAHLIYLPRTLEDIDSVNFALGVRDFDVAAHQPHPPGYPLFIALAKMTTGALQTMGVPGAPSRALALLSALSGALLVPLLMAFYRRISHDARLAGWATAVAVCSPLFWMTALRPLSDMTGLAFAVGAQALLAAAIVGPRESAGDAGAAGPRRQAVALIAGAALCGIGAGARSQTVMLTAPLLVAALFWPGNRVRWVHRGAALMAAVAGGLSWGIPLVVASGGVDDYLAALGTQAGEDFAGVVMLWTSPEPRVAFEAVMYSFVRPWGPTALGVSVAAIGTIGVARMGLRLPRALAMLVIGYAPYAVFHLLFQETATIRYALPLVVPAAFLVVQALAGVGRLGIAAAGVVVVASLAIGLPAASAYARLPGPAFAAFGTITATPPAAEILGMHAVVRRVADWERARHPVRILPAPHGAEWLSLVEHWRREPDMPIQFIADPRRTDLALFDSRSRELVRSFGWEASVQPFLAGTRPAAVDLYRMHPPGWMLDRGWALTAEIGGVTARHGLGPQVTPSVAWVRSRDEQAMLTIGGRNLGAGGDPVIRVTVSSARGEIDAWDVAPGFFFHRTPLAAGALAGAGYQRLQVSAAAADGTGSPVRLSLEQFDLQSAGTSMLGLVNGWHEPEFNVVTARAWRWMSERATLWVRPVGRDQMLSITGESPLRYFDRAPNVRVSIGGKEIARFAQTADFLQRITLPSALLEKAGGDVQLDSDLWFSPADSEGGADKRRLALRVYGVALADAR